MSRAAKMEYCWHCDRNFRFYQSFHQHARSKHPALYCVRCERLFSSRSARQQHDANSSSHHICWRCPSNHHRPDFRFQWQLDEHAEMVHNWCRECGLYFDSQSQLGWHEVYEHNLCCGTYYTSPSNLKSVSTYPLWSTYLPTYLPTITE